MKKVIFIMGVSGCGKSTIGTLLSQKLSIPFFDGDDFHPTKNIEKMASGKPLNDDDRQPWLATLNDLAKNKLTKKGCIIACSALKKKYRKTLSKNIEKNTKWVHLTGSFEVIQKRINGRENHFMAADLLKSQFDTLENPENALSIDITTKPAKIIQTITKDFKNFAEFGLFGLGVMGKSLCRNLARNGVKISMFNRHVENVEEHVAENFKAAHSELKNALAFDEISSFVASLAQPRKILLMVNAGKIIDLVIDDLVPHLDKNDIIIDGGNSNYQKTKERCEYLKNKGIQFIGIGVSGGEEGALKGPSIMPSGDLEAYKNVQKYLEKIAAKDQNNLPCCTYVGPEGSGHFVKMVHNGIEYAEMQLLAEITSVLEATGRDLDEISAVLSTWKSEANSYLLDITKDILQKKENGDWLVKKIVDKAGNKGTGNWATIATTTFGIPSTMITTALFARYISFYKEERILLEKNHKKAKKTSLKLEINQILEAYQFAQIINHYQGFKLITEASTKFSWDINLSEVARIWTNGCIIKSDLMQDFVEILKETTNILTHKGCIETLQKNKESIKKVVSECALQELNILCLSESLQFYFSITNGNSNANIIQAQRDFFGAHTYQRVDDTTGKSYHTQWKNINK